MMFTMRMDSIFSCKLVFKSQAICLGRKNKAERIRFAFLFQVKGLEVVAGGGGMATVQSPSHTFDSPSPGHYKVSSPAHNDNAENVVRPTGF